MKKWTKNNFFKKELNWQQTIVVETNLAFTKIENSTKIPDKK